MSRSFVSRLSAFARLLQFVSYFFSGAWTSSAGAVTAAVILSTLLLRPWCCLVLGLYFGVSAGFFWVLFLRGRVHGVIVRDWVLLGWYCVDCVYYVVGLMALGFRYGLQSCNNGSRYVLGQSLSS